MEQIIKFFSSILMLLLGFFMCMSVVLASSLRIDADEYKSDVIGEIENSNFNAAVITYCKEQAASNGYTLEVSNCQYDEDNNLQIAEVIIEYPYKIPLFGISTTKQVRGIAR